MNNICIQNSLTATVFKLQVILLIMEDTESQKVAITHLDRLPCHHHVKAMEKVAI